MKRNFLYVVFLVVLSSLVHAEEGASFDSMSFHSMVNGQAYTTTINRGDFKPGVTKNLLVKKDGKWQWQQEAKVSLLDATVIATKEARRIIGVDFDMSWELSEAGRSQQGGGGMYIHLYKFSFSQDFTKVDDPGNLQVLVGLDGKVLPIVKK